MKTKLYCICIYALWGLMAQAEQIPLLPPGNYPSDYMCHDYPLVFEDGTLTPDGKEFILNDYKLVWDNSVPSGLDRIYPTNEAKIITIPSVGNVIVYGDIAREASSIDSDNYRHEFEQIGTIAGFGAVLPVTRILSDGYRAVRELPNFEAAYSALDGFFYNMNHLEETSLATVGDIMAIRGRADEDIAGRNIRYYIEESRGTQYRSTSVLNFAIGQGDVANQLTSFMEMRQEGSKYLSKWSAWPIVYEDGKWKMYASTEWE